MNERVTRSECPKPSDNAEASIKCKQCGNMITVGNMSPEEAVPCPVCGATMSAADLLDTSASNEGY